MAEPGLFVRLQAKPGKAEQLSQFLRDALPLVQQESGTTAWFAMRSGASFAIFDVFADEAGRQAHLAGAVAHAIKQGAAELLQQPPIIETVDVLAEKMPSDQ